MSRYHYLETQINPKAEERSNLGAPGLVRCSGEVIDVSEIRYIGTVSGLKSNPTAPAFAVLLRGTDTPLEIRFAPGVTAGQAWKEHSRLVNALMAHTSQSSIVFEDETPERNADPFGREAAAGFALALAVAHLTMSNSPEDNAAAKTLSAYVDLAYPQEGNVVRANFLKSRDSLIDDFREADDREGRP